MPECRYERFPSFNCRTCADIREALRAQFSVVFGNRRTGLWRRPSEDTTPQAMTTHQLMKDCIAKQKASDGGALAQPVPAPGF